MKVVVTGAAGQLGADLVGELRRAGHAVVALDRAALDITDRFATIAALDSARPDVVVNGAAFTAVDDCEDRRELAFAVNEQGARHLAIAADAVGARLVHVSTDYVFDGTQSEPYAETDTPNPQSVYGESKLAGEIAVFDVLESRSTIVRTSWVCGLHGHNMVKLVRRLAAEGRDLAFVDDQRGCPSFTSDLATAIEILVREPIAGVVHLTNSGAVSWFEFVGDILDASGFDRTLVRPISTTELDPPRPAPRPANSVLENRAWSLAGHSALRDFREPLAELVARLGRV